VMEIRLREFREGDLEEVHRIERCSYPTPWSMNFFRLMANMNPELFIVATVDEELVGYTVGEVDTRRNGGKVGHVMNVAVDSRHRDRGVGTLLMEELEARFLRLGATVAYLEVRESNVDAQRLYSRRGYVNLRKVEGYYGDEDGLVMTKALDE
jgi:ribosomal-protein-alanine N-acetyltransferase